MGEYMEIVKKKFSGRSFWAKKKYAKNAYFATFANLRKYIELHELSRFFSEKLHEIT